MYYDHEGKILEEYSKAPLEILHDKKLKDFSKLLYFEIYSIYDQNSEVTDYVFIRDEVLAKKMGVSVSSVEKALKMLEENHYILRITSNYDKKRDSKLRHIHIRALNEIQRGNNKGKIPYVEFPKTIYIQKLNPTAKILLIELMHLEKFKADEFGKIEVSNNVLAERFGKGRRTIIRNIDQLEAEKFISVRRTVNNKRHIYLEDSEIWFESYGQYGINGVI